MQPVDMTHSGKPEFVVLKLGESGKPKVVSPWVSRLIGGVIGRFEASLPETEDSPQGGKAG